MYIKTATTLILFLVTCVYGLAQMPTHIDPGQSKDPKSIGDEPEYIVLLVALIALLVLFFFWIRRRK